MEPDNADDDAATKVANKVGAMVARTVGGAGLPTAVYGAAATFGTAGTGTAISTLSGAAATSATTALLGFGSAALGGVVLFGLGVAGAIVAGRYCGKVGGKIVKAVRAAQTDSARDET